MSIRPPFFAALVACLLAAGAALPAGAESRPRVVVTLKPIHSLVAGVMAGIAEPELLITGAGSPHAYALKPSQARSLAEADVVVRVSPDLEVFLNRSLANLSGTAKLVDLDKTAGIALHHSRETGLAKHHETSRDPDKHDHKHRGHKHSGHKHGGHKHKAVAKRDADDHDHGATDLHLWLDPDNAAKLTGQIARVLAETYPAHANEFAANAQELQARLTGLDAELRKKTQPLKDAPYIVFHDAYRYFEERYGLRFAGSVTVDPDRIPGARRLSALRKHIRGTHAICVFSEPQFEPKLVSLIIEGSTAKTGVLDPLGAELAAGPEQYFTLMRALADSFSACLSQGPQK